MLSPSSERDESIGRSRKRRCACRDETLATASAATTKHVIRMYDGYNEAEARGRDWNEHLPPPRVTSSEGRPPIPRRYYAQDSTRRSPHIDPATLLYHSCRP